MPFQKGNTLYKFRTSNNRIYKPRISWICKWCEKEIMVQPYLIKTKQYCSKQCQANFQKTIPKEQHPSWKGNRGWVSKGYRYIIINGKNILEHRHIMQQVLGRKLSRHEHVHHINKIKTDNRPENLLVVTDREHKQFHKLTSWAKKYTKCVECNTIKIKHHSRGYCEDCYLKIYRHLSALGPRSWVYVKESKSNLRVFNSTSTCSPPATLIQTSTNCSRIS